MRKLIILTSLLITAAAASADNRYSFTSQGLDVLVTFYSPNIVRVTKTPQGVPYEGKSFSVIMQPQVDVGVSQQEKDRHVMLSTSRIAVVIDRRSGETFRVQVVGNPQKTVRDSGKKVTVKL